MEMSSGKVGIEFRNYCANFDKYFAIIAKFNPQHLNEILYFQSINHGVREVSKIGLKNVKKCIGK